VEPQPLVLWSVYPDDTIPAPPPHTIARRVLARVRPGSIILLHETDPKTVAAVPEIIAGLRSRGYTPVMLSTLLATQAEAARKHSPSRQP
jgi:peptidoglycan/xylan/chitin deacetylase (PgdA/CDA1 family)